MEDELDEAAEVAGKQPWKDSFGILNPHHSLQGRPGSSW